MTTPMRLAARVAAVTFALGAGLFAALLYRTLELGRGGAQPVHLETVNPGGEFLGPEGIQFDASGKLYVGDALGRVWSAEPGARPQVWADLSRGVQGEGLESGPIHIGGMAFDTRGALYLCAYGFAGGSILRVEPGGGTARIFARDLGVANYLVICADENHLWASDYRKEGRLLRFALDAPAPARPDLALTGLQYPNGLALGRDERTLYAAETYAGTVARITFGDGAPAVERIIDLKGFLATGSLDGLTFDPRDRNRRFLYVAENIRGLFTVLDLHATPVRMVKQLGLSRMGGRPCPASMVIRDGYLYFTDLWSASPLRILLGFPRLRQHAHRFRVTDLTALY